MVLIQFRINDSKYIVMLKKDYNKKWEVTDCYLEEQDDSNSGDGQVISNSAKAGGLFLSFRHGLRRATSLVRGRQRLPSFA